MLATHVSPARGRRPSRLNIQHWVFGLMFISVNADLSGRGVVRLARSETGRA